MDVGIENIALKSAGARADIRELGLEELGRVVEAAGERSFRARQLARWLYGRGAQSFDVMLELPAAFREYLKDNFTIGSARIAAVRRSVDGTRKLLVELAGGEAIEAVIIPAEGRVTLCLSTQAGCAMGCTFCATARMGLRRNLGVGEILGQIFLARGELGAGEELTNYVFMGMGEPLANYPRLKNALSTMTAKWGMGISPRRITVSTVGLVPMMERLLADVPVRLAVSIHATTDRTRDRIAPVNRRYPLRALIEACARMPLKHRDRITFEYVMLAGVNDSPADAKRLARMLAPLRAKVNLIFFNPFPGSGFEAAGRRAVEDFQGILRQGNLTATVRESRGADIAAACGQLYAERAASPERHAG
jgi:23S rRNA (adenine2503-C2)-methyltransferase